MKILRFEDIIAWQKAQEIAVKIYATLISTEKSGLKKQTENFKFKIV